MNTFKIRINEIHPEDAFYSTRREIVGKIFEITEENLKNIHQTELSWFYIDINKELTLYACHYELIN